MMNTINIKHQQAPNISSAIVIMLACWHLAESTAVSKYNVIELLAVFDTIFQYIVFRDKIHSYQCLMNSC